VPLPAQSIRNALTAYLYTDLVGTLINPEAPWLKHVLSFWRATFSAMFR